MKLTPTMEKFVLHWGEMGTRWGVNRSVAQIHALLYLAPAPMHAEEIASTLGIARSNVSTSLKELQAWELISVTHVLGDRRDHFDAKKDVWEIINTIVDGRKRREIDPTLAFLRECVSASDSDRQMPDDVKRRIRELLEFTTELHTWHGQIRSMPQKTVRRLLKMGARIANLVGR